MAKSSVSAVAGFVVGLPLVRELWRVRAEIGATRRALREHAGSSPAGSTRFHNSEPATEVADGGALTVAKAMLQRVDEVRPSGPIPLVHSDFGPASAELAVTWLGHASVLFEIDGHTVLADPVWESRVSPSTWLGPTRLHAAPLGLAELPEIDAVVISHDHYDHLERSTIVWLAEHRRCRFVVPIGLGEHLRGWGVPAERVIELTWGQRASVGALELVCTEVRHFSGRGLRRNDTLWSGWAILGPTARAYFGGDSGYSACFERTGLELGPFDVTVLPIGAYSEFWPDVHMNPEEALRAHQDLNPGATAALLPIHWATFVLARHSWSEPIERLVAAVDAAVADGNVGAALLIPRPGERMVVGDEPDVETWWRGL
nr:MBL fold metallo-hydrolase [Tomitella biformata]